MNILSSMYSNLSTSLFLVRLESSNEMSMFFSMGPFWRRAVLMLLYRVSWSITISGVDSNNGSWSTLSGKNNFVWCYESPKQEKVSHTFEHLIQNPKAYNGIRI